MHHFPTEPTSTDPERTSRWVPAPARPLASRASRQTPEGQPLKAPGGPDGQVAHENKPVKPSPHTEITARVDPSHEWTSEAASERASSDADVNTLTSALAEAIDPPSALPHGPRDTEHTDELPDPLRTLQGEALLRSQAPVSIDEWLGPPVLLAQAPSEVAAVNASDAGTGSLGAFDRAIPSAVVAAEGRDGMNLGWLGALGAGLVALAGGRGGGSSPADEPAVTFTISGGLMAGPIINTALTVTAYDASGNVLGSTTTHQADDTGVGGVGYYTLTLSRPGFNGGAVLLRVTDPSPGGLNDYIDEATGLPVDIGDLRALVYLPPSQGNATASASSNTSADTPITSTQVKAYITPLTTLAAELIAPLPKSDRDIWKLPAGVGQTQIVNTNQQVATLFGLDAQADVTTTQPVSVISSNGEVHPGGNAYGKALAVWSLAQAQNAGWTVPTLAADLKSSSTSDLALKFSEAVAPGLQVASFQAVSKGFLSTAEAYQLQQSSTAGTSTTSVNFQFAQAELTLPAVDPAQALGQEVYRLRPITTAPAEQPQMPDNGLRLYNVNTTDTSHFRIDLQDTVQGSHDADAFTWDPVAGSLVLNAQAASQVQGAGGHTYHVTLRATADVLDTPLDPTDDIVISQALTLTVQDTTAPLAPSAFAIAFKSIAGVQTQGSGAGATTTVGTAGLVNPEGFLTLANLLPPDEPGVRYQVNLTLLNRISHASITRSWSDWFNTPESARHVALTPDEVEHLGNGTIDVQTSVTATDLADHVSGPVVSTASFVLDTVVTTPGLSLLNYPNSTLSGDGWLRLEGLEEGGRYSYVVYNGLDSTSGVVLTSPAPVTYHYNAGAQLARGVATLDLHALGSGDYTIRVTQQDAYGNSSTATQSFTLALDAPSGVDASIESFVLTPPGGQAATPGDLFYLNSADDCVLSGTWKGQLADNETLQLGVGRRETDGSVTWQWGDNLFNQLVPDAQGQRSWNLDPNGVSHWRAELPATVSGGSLLGVRLVDSLGHASLLTTRSYVYQTQDVLLPPTAAWIDATVDTQDTTTSSLKVSVTGLAAHAQAQYQLSRSTTPPLDDDLGWVNTVPQPFNDGSNDDRWYLFVRQRDLLTGQVSAASDPLVLHFDNQPPARIAGLVYEPLDNSSWIESNSVTITRDQVTLHSDDQVTEWQDASGQPVYRGQVVSIVGNWTDADEGATLSAQWGHALRTHTLTRDDIVNGRVDIWWSPDDILSQPGNVTVQAWTTDLAGNTSASYTRSFVVDSRETAAAVAQTQPAFLGVYTRLQATDAYGADADNTLNKAEASAGVQLRMQMALKQADGTPIDWSKGFKLMLFAKAPGDTWNNTSVTTGTLTAGSTGNSGMAWDANTGQVSWTLNLNNPLGSSLFSSQQGGLRDWKVQVRNFAYTTSSPLYLSETPLTELKVDTLAPGSLSSASSGTLSLSLEADGLRTASLGLNQTVLKALVNYSGMAVGDTLEFQSQKSGASAASTLLRYQLRSEDFTGTQAVLSLARDSITQNLGDGSYTLGLRVTDTAGNTTTLAKQATVNVDTQGPAAPIVSWPALDVQHPLLHDGYLNANEATTDIKITWPSDHAVNDTLHWVVGGVDLDPTLVNRYIQVKQTDTVAGVTTTTYTLDKRVFGSVDVEGVKDLRVNLTDAYGNQGAYSNVLTLVLDSQPHDAPKLLGQDPTGHISSVPSPSFLPKGASVHLDIADPQSAAGDTLQLSVVLAGDGHVPWQQKLLVTDPLQTTLTLSQTGVWSFAGQTGTMASLMGAGGLASGEYRVTASVTDLAGNVSQLSQPYHLVVDLDAPLNQAVAGTFQFEQHAVVDATATAQHHRAFITREAHQLITVQLKTALQSATSATGAESLWGRVVAPDHTTDPSSALEGWVDLSAAVTGTTLSWNTATSGLELKPGVNVIQLEVRDAAGNRGAITQQQYVLDTTPPTTTVQPGTLTFSSDSAPTSGQGTPAGLGLDHDLLTHEPVQTLGVDLSAALIADANDSATWGSAQEHLWGSVDNGNTWFDVTSFVQGHHLSWQLANTRNPVTGELAPLALTGSNTLRLKVMDVAGNVGAQFSQAYGLDTDPPTAQALRLQFGTDTGVGGADSPSHHDFITNQSTTSLNLSLNQALSAGDRVYVSLDKGVMAQTYDITADLAQQGAFDAATWSSSTPVFNVGSDTSTEANTRFTLLPGGHTLSVWVEDRVGNPGTVLDQAYVYASQAPELDLAGQAAGADFTRHVTATQAQRGVALGDHITVGSLTTDIAEVVVNVATVNSDNGSNERLLIAPGIDIDLNSSLPTPVDGLRVTGVDGWVQWTPTGGGGMHFAKFDAAGQNAYFSAAEVQALLGGLRYFNTANSDDITAGDRSFSVQLVDRATNASAVHTATLTIAASDAASLSTSANAQDNTIVGSTGDDVLFGLQGHDMLSGHGGNNTYLWLQGDAASANGMAVSDVITDFHAWNPTTQTGDRLDIARLLEGYTSAATLDSYVSVDNQATVNGTGNSTRLSIHVDGTSAGAVQIIELQGVVLGTPGMSSTALLQELVTQQQLKVL